MKKSLRFLSKLGSIKSGLVKLTSRWPNVSIGQLVRSGIGVMAVLLLAWWTVGISSYGGRPNPWPLIIVMAIATALGLTIVLVPREQYVQLFRRHFGWLPVTLGALSYPYWIWYSDGVPADIGFFQTTAQVLPVILLAAIVDVRQSSILKSNQLALPIIAVFLGELAALNETAFQASASAVGRVPADFAVVASSLVTSIAALIMAVLADLKHDLSDTGHARSSDTHGQGQSESQKGPRESDL